MAVVEVPEELNLAARARGHRGGRARPRVPRVARPAPHLGRRHRPHPPARGRAARRRARHRTARLDDCEGWESPHDHVALYLHNGNEYLEGMLGAAKARAVGGQRQLPLRGRGAPLRPPRQPGAGDRLPRRLRADARARCCPRSPSRRCSSRSTTTPARPLLPGAVAYEAALAGRRPRPPEELSPDDLYILYTGGTTGMPKGVLWRQADFLAACLGIDQTTDAARRGRPALEPAGPPGRRRSCTAPPTGTPCRLDDRRHRRRSRTIPSRLDPHDVLDTVERERATSLLIVGDAFARPLVDALRDRAPTTCRACATCSPAAPRCRPT